MLLFICFFASALSAGKRKLVELFKEVEMLSGRFCRGNRCMLIVAPVVMIASAISMSPSHDILPLGIDSHLVWCIDKKNKRRNQRVSASIIDVVGDWSKIHDPARNV